jgi:hypothetical protein
MDDHIVKIIPSPKGKERIVILRRPDGTYTHYRQCRWNNHKAYSTALFTARRMTAGHAPVRIVAFTFRRFWLNRTL